MYKPNEICMVIYRWLGPMGPTTSESESFIFENMICFFAMKPRGGQEFVQDDAMGCGSIFQTIQ